MHREPVLSKKQMYAMRDAGAFGNVIPRWTTLDSWVRTGPGADRLWGVQHTTIAGFPGTRLDVKTDAVHGVIEAGGFGFDYCISPMVHQYGAVKWEGDIALDPTTGRVFCSGNPAPAPGSWRRHMLKPRLYEGSAALVLLDNILNPASREDLEHLLLEYPGHVIELSALDVCFGTVPGRNAVIWEVRKY